MTRTPTAETWKRLRSEPLPFLPLSPRSPEERCFGPSLPCSPQTKPGHSTDGRVGSGEFFLQDPSCTDKC
jgi:hypothetical protein